MLILSRKKGEAIIIGDNIVVTVADIRGSKVSLGIEAPKDVVVNRHEIDEAIKRSGNSEMKLPEIPSSNE